MHLITIFALASSLLPALAFPGGGGSKLESLSPLSLSSSSSQTLEDIIPDSEWGDTDFWRRSVPFIENYKYVTR